MYIYDFFTKYDVHLILKYLKIHIYIYKTYYVYKILFD